VSGIRVIANYAVLVSAMAVTASLALGWFPLWFAFGLCILMVGALLLGFWLGNKVVNQRRR
jgi:hypothetical protein